MLRRSNATTGPRGGVNRQFLVNTVRGVQAHNRREEEEDCWRLHRMQDKRSEVGVSAIIDSKSDYPVERARLGSSCDNRSDDQSASEIVNSRKHWAEVKRRAMSQRPSAEDNVDSCEPSPVDARKKDTRSNTSLPKGKCLGKRKRKGRDRRESDKGSSTDEEPTKKRASSRKSSASENHYSKKTRKRKKKR